MTANSAAIGSHTDYQLPLFAFSVTTNCIKFGVSMTTNKSDLVYFAHKISASVGIRTFLFCQKPYAMPGIDE